MDSCPLLVFRQHMLQPQLPHLSSPRSSQAPGSARRGLHLELSRQTLWAASKIASVTIVGTGIPIHSDSGRARERADLRPTAELGSASVRL